MQRAVLVPTAWEAGSMQLGVLVPTESEAGSMQHIVQAPTIGKYELRPAVKKLHQLRPQGVFFTCISCFPSCQPQA